ncbi:hypothetical protein [Bradyrhizobium sp. 23AC]
MRTDEGSLFAPFNRTKQRQCGGESRVDVISIGFDAPVEPGDCFSILVNLYFGKAYYHEPAMSEDIAGREAKCFFDMGFSLSPATHIQLGAVNLRLSQIAIQRQRSFKLSDALNHALGAD